VLAIEDCHWQIGCLEVVEQAGIDCNATGLPVPLSVRLERGAIGVEVAAASAAEVIRDKLRVPPIDSVTVGLRGVKSFGLKVRVEMASLRTERARASRQFLGDFAVDAKRIAATVAASFKCHAIRS